MNYEEFKKWDEYGLYSDYESVKMAEEDGSIPKEFIGIFSEPCGCGSEMIIKIDKTGKSHLKSIMCCDPNCKIKMAHAMADMFSNFEIKGLAFKTCYKIVSFCLDQKIFTVPCHTEIMKLKEDSDLRFFLGSDWVTLWCGVESIRNRQMTFAQMISKISIPFFGKDSERIFNDVNSIKHLIEIEKKYTIRHYLNCCSVYDEKAIKSLIDNLQTILIFESSLVFGLKMPGFSLKRIVVTGSVTADGHKMSRDFFKEYCDIIGNVNGVQLFNVQINKAFDSAEYAIADSPSSSRTYLKALEIQNLTDKKFIITAQEYVDILRKEVEECLSSVEEEMKKSP